MYNDLVDGETKYGSSHSLPRRSFVGGSWSHSSNCGSRSVTCVIFSASLNSDIATRGCKENRNILGRLGMVLIML